MFLPPFCHRITLITPVTFIQVKINNPLDMLKSNFQRQRDFDNPSFTVLRSSGVTTMRENLILETSEKCDISHHQADLLCRFLQYQPRDIDRFVIDSKYQDLCRYQSGMYVCNNNPNNPNNLDNPWMFRYFG